MKIVSMLFVCLMFIGCSRNTDKKDKSSSYDIICIDGHQYYRHRGHQVESTAIKLSPEGKPVYCDN